MNEKFSSSLLYFNSPKERNLEKLLNLVGNLRESQVIINNEEEIDPRIFMYTANCTYRYYCEKIFNPPPPNDDEEFVLDSEDDFEIYDDDVELNLEAAFEEYLEDLIARTNHPLGYICKTIRRKDGEVVDVSYKSFDDMIASWEQADYPRDKYIINIIKPLYDEDEALQQRTIKTYEKKYKG